MAQKAVAPDPDEGFHVHVMDGDDEAAKVEVHLCRKHYDEARGDGKLTDRPVRRQDDCGGRCDLCPAPKIKL